MSSKLPQDLIEVALGFIRGYQRRSRQCNDLRDAIESGAKTRPYHRIIVKTGAGVRNDPTFEAVAQLEMLDKSFDMKAMDIVDEALTRVTNDFPQGECERVQQAIYLNCLSGRKYPYEHFSIAVSRTDFYRRRNEMLYHVLNDLGYIDKCFVS